MQSKFTLLLAIFTIIIASACKQGTPEKQPEEVYPTIEKAALFPDSIHEIDIRFENIGQPLFGFPEKFTAFKNLRTLRLAGHPLTIGHPEQLTQLKNLEELDLRMTQLDTLPKELGGMVQLKKLVVASNGANHLPDELGMLVNLELLDVGFTRDSTMNRIFCNFKKMEDLNIEACLLKEIPLCVMQMKLLKKLNAPYNYLRKLPDNLGELEQLEYLGVYGHSFKNTDAEIEKLKVLVDLKEIYINGITEKQTERIRQILPDVKINNPDGPLVNK
jgi:Leucine-rich repeat (LRR) protein